MATAILDVNINEGDTFVMDIEFWHNIDQTLPIDISNDIFAGSFEFAGKNIPMVCTIIGVNVLEVKVDYTVMVDLPKKGKYDIDQTTEGDERFRIMQGDVRVSAEVTK